MPLQQQVHLSAAPGAAGDNVAPNQSVYASITPLAATALPVGGFVFPVVENGVQDTTRAVNTAGSATEVLGFAERVINYVNADVFSPGTLTVPQGSALTVAVAGDYRAVSSTDAAVGQKVLASAADGSVSTGEPDAAHIDTGWVVKTPGAAGEPIIISRRNSEPTASAGTGGNNDTDF